MFLNYIIQKSVIGFILLVSVDNKIIWLSFSNNKEILLKEFNDFYTDRDKINNNNDLFLNLCMKKINHYLNNPSTSDLKSIPLFIKGTDFQNKIWNVIREIKIGETIFYTQLAQKIGHPNAIRAVANACAKNTIGLLIPCHRIVKNDGSISGYRWGVNNKKILLDLEKSRGSI